MRCDRFARPRTIFRAAIVLAAGVLLWSMSMTATAREPGASRQDAAPPSVVVVPAYRQANIVAVLTVEGPIDMVTLTSLERRVEEARRLNADAIVIELNTPGGRVDATLDITHLIKTECPPNTVAWINPKAYSAGTIIALACREILVAPDAAFGDSAPVSPFGPLSETEREKAETPLRREVIDSARRHHYDENLVQAFISLGVELWMIEHTTTGERVFVDRTEYARVFGAEPPEQLTPVAPPPSESRQPVRPFFDRFFEMEETRRGPGLTPEQREFMKQFEQELPPPRDPLTADDRAHYQLVRQVVRNDHLLTLKPSDAIAYGLARRVVANDEELKAYFGAREIVRLDASWSESLVRFLISGWVRGLLIAVFVIALFIELAAPGFGAFGITAMVALAILLGAPALVGMAQWWEIFIIALGLALIMVELFIIPGTMIAGIAGAACLLVGLVGTFVDAGVGTPEGQAQLVTGVLATLGGLFIAIIGVWLLSRQLQSMPFFNRLVLSSGVSKGDGAAVGLLEAMNREPRDVLVPGATGIAETDLRPAGRVLIDGRLIDVVTSGGFIERGTPVRVISVGRFRIEVEGIET